MTAQAASCRSSGIAVAVVVGALFLAGPGRASPIIAGYSPKGIIWTFDFATSGPATTSFVPSGSSAWDWRGRAVEVVGNTVYYTTQTSDIHLAPFNNGAGGPDIGTIPNPRPGYCVQDLDYANGVLYALTGYVDGAPIVYQLNPVTGAVLGSVAIHGPGTRCDAFTVLPSGDYLINDDNGAVTYRGYSSVTGDPTGLVITVPTPGGAPATGVDFNPSDGLLYFHGWFFQVGLYAYDGFARSTVTGANFTLGVGPSNVCNGIQDISVVVPSSPCTYDWSPLGTGVDNYVLALWPHTDGIYVSGTFTSAGGSPAHHIARWTGTAWAPLGSGIDGHVFAMASFQGQLYAGGSFTTAGGVAASNIARWDGTSWWPVGTGTNDEVTSLTVYDDGSGAALYAGGIFTVAGGSSAKRVAKWDGASWSALGAGISGGVSPQVGALQVFDDGSGAALIVGGQFTTAGSTPVNNVARWKNGTWLALGSDIVAGPLALTVFQGALYAGGDGGPHIARWNGGTWSPVGGGTNFPVLAFAVFDDGRGPALYAGGNFTLAGSTPANYVARWDGTSWEPLGTGTNTQVNALTATSDALYAGGFFSTAGGLPASFVAQWRCSGSIGSLRGAKYQDLNHDGVHQTGEPPLADWTINLSGAASGSATTLGDGSYSFVELPVGPYEITESNVPGWVNTGSFSHEVNLTGDLTGYDFENWQCRDDRPDTCIAPPRHMVAWYPFDEDTGTVCHDYAGGSSGSFVGSPTWVGAGKVGHAIHFPGGSNYVSVPAPPLLDFGTGSFTIDAWIRTTMPAGGVQCFLDKRVTQSIGYALYLYQGKFGIGVGSGTWTNFWGAGPELNDGNWHHVAATVCRPAGGTATVKLYTDGILRGTFTSGVPTGSVSNTGPLFIGQRNVDGQADFIGDVDELELMAQCLDAPTIQRIATAGPGGKCRDDCHISYVAPWLLGHSHPYLVICNNSGTAQSYHWSVAPCSANGLSFSPNSGTAQVAAHNCQSIYLHGIVPAMSPGQSLCFATTVLNDGTGHCFTCSGTVTRPHHWSGMNSSFEAIPLSQTKSCTLLVYNSDSTSHQMHYRLSDICDGDTADAIVRLNGLPTRTPVTGTLAIAGGGWGAVDFTAQMDEFETFRVHEIVLAGDLDGNGVYEDICALPVVALASTEGLLGVAATPAPDFARITVSPNPSRQTSTMQFALPAPCVVHAAVYDVLGRLVRVLRSGWMPAGQHRVEWDGRDAHGAAVHDGVYFVRVRVGNRVLTAKVVRMR